MRQYIVAKNVLDVIFYNHTGHGEKKNISREEMSHQRIIIKKRVLPVRFKKGSCQLLVKVCARSTG